MISNTRLLLVGGESLSFYRAWITKAEVFQPRQWGLFPNGDPVLRLHLSLGRTMVADFEVSEPEDWVQALGAMPPSLPPVHERLAEALEQQIDEPEAYLDVLAQLSFPQGFWHPESVENAREIGQATAKALNINLPAPWKALDLAVSEDMEEGAVRLHQIQQMVAYINTHQPGSGRRLYLFEPVDLWEEEEPFLYLWLSKQERQGLLQLGVIEVSGEGFGCQN